MKKLFKRLLPIVLCFALLGSISAGAITPSYTPYQGYEYNSYQESVAAPIGYTAVDKIKGSDLEYTVKTKSLTDAASDDHDSDHPFMYVLDSKAGIVYKTDMSLNIVCSYETFKSKSGAKLSLKGATKIACDYSGAFFYVYKSGTIYVINGMAEVVKTISASGVNTLASYAMPGEEDGVYDTILMVGSGSSIKAYTAKGKYIGSSTVGSNITDITYSVELGTIYALDAGANKILTIEAVTDYDDNGNEVFKKFEKSEAIKPDCDISGAKALGADGNGAYCYVALDNKLGYVDLMDDGKTTFVTKKDVPSNVKTPSFNYNCICYNGDGNSSNYENIFCFANDNGPQAVEFNLNKGYVSQRSDLTIKLSAPTDMHYVDHKYIYIMDSGNSRILKVDKKLKKVLDVYTNFYDAKKDKYVSFYGASGFAMDDEKFYIADTEGEQVIVAYQTGEVDFLIKRPDEQLQDSDAPFRTTKILLDRKDQIYVLCDAINLGAFVFEKDGKFKSFFGSNTVVTTSQVIMDYIKKQFMTREQILSMRKSTPIALTNFDIDEGGFIYTVTETEQDSRNQQFDNMVRKLNYQGKNIFQLTGDSGGFGDFEWNRTLEPNNTSFCDVDVDDEGYINLIDSGKNKVFQYTKDGGLVTIYGGDSDQFGMLEDPSSIESVDGQVYVLDDKLDAFIVYSPTDYTKCLRKAYDLLDNADYDKSIAAWNDVLKYNTNSEFPYYGLGRAYEQKGDFNEAMHYFKLANSKSSYSKAFSEYRTDFASKNILWILLIIIAIIAVIVVIVKLSKKYLTLRHGEAYSPLETKWGLPFYCLIHPVDGFEQFRTRNMTCVPIAIGLGVLTFLARIYQYFGTGFAFNNNRAIDYNLFASVVGSIGIFVLFAIANWAVCTLLNGKGRMKEIICVVGYSLIPYIASLVLSVILTNFTTLSEAAFVSLISTLGLVWTIIILLLGLYSIHQYSFLGTIGSVLLTIFGMAVIGVLLVLFFTLLQQCWSFIVSVVNELKLR